MATDPYIEYLPLRQIQAWPGNPKNHDLDELEASLARFGFVGAVVRDEGTGRLVAGHGRLEALEARRVAGHPPPERVKVLPDGDWAVPVIRGISFETPEEAEAYLVTDNRQAQLGGWDNAKLGVILSRLKDGAKGVVGTGFNRRAVEAVTRRLKTAVEAAGLGNGEAPDVDPPPQPKRAKEAVYRVVLRAEDADDQRRLMQELSDLGYDCTAETR